MEANKIKLLEFIGSGKKTFNIPVYQRNYDWKQEHCERLFRDVEKIAKSNNTVEHFLGTVVYVISSAQLNYTEFVLIDGQQRVTSVTLLLKALHDCIEDSELKEDIYESYIINKRAPEELRVKLKPIESDMRAYESLLNNDVKDEDYNIVKNYNYFVELIKGSDIPAESLYNALSNIELVYIQLEKDKKSENPQMIFESLNSTGLSLTEADLIRNFLLMNHSYDEQTKLYKEYWVKIEKQLTNSKVSDFVRDYLTMKTGKISTKQKVYENFKEFALNPEVNMDEQGLLEDLLIFGKYYSAFLYFNSDNDEINYYLEQFQTLKSTTVYPVLLYIFDECYTYKKITEDDIIEILKIFISYIFRRIICGYPTNALNKIFATLIQELDSSDEPKYADRLLKVLTSKTATGTFPRNKEFKKDFLNKKIYKNKADKYLLCQLENAVSKEKVQISSAITIEHIMPQTLSPQWSIELGKRANEIHEQYLDTIGNLAITGYNSELSNMTFSEKCEIYKDSNISTCRNICEYVEWNDESIIKRAESLYEIASSIWSLPQRYDTENSKHDEIDYSMVYNLMTNVSVTGEKPKQIIVMDTEFNVSSWKEMLRTLARELCELDSSIFCNLATHKDFSGRDRRIIDIDGSNMKVPYKVAENLYFETNLSASDILNYCRILCEHYSMIDDVYFMLNINNK